MDDESGLMFYGARYYNPLLGRFITPDTVVQSSNDPQTLNRYSYCSNNPTNRVDPTGRSWKKYFKAIFDTIKYAFNPVQSDPIVHGIVTGNWSYVRDMAIAGATGFVFGGPIGMATAMITTAVMRTPIAQWTVENYAHYYYDNVLGMRPGTAYIWSYMTISTAVSLGTESTLASMNGQPAQTRKLTPEEKEYLRQHGNFAGDEDMFGPSLKTNDAFRGKGSRIEALEVNQKFIGSYESTTLDVPGLKELGARHSAANMLGASSKSISPFSYATWGTCHQATNLTLLQGGTSSTILSLEGNWSQVATTVIYGNYGGQLWNRIYSGVQANNQYNEI